MARIGRCVIGIHLRAVDVALVVVVQLDSTRDGGARSVYTFHARNGQVSL
ncbi:hypothetical protein [Nocardia sp. NPDC051832]